MSRFLIFFVILIIWVIYNFMRARSHAGEASGKMEKSSGGTGHRNPVPGRKYSWAWMQSAGDLRLEFIRPEKANGYPAISGAVNRINISVQCIPPHDGIAESTSFRFHFPESAGIGLTLALASDGKELKKLAHGRESQSLPDDWAGRKLPEYFLRVKNADVLKCCMPESGMEHLSRLALIYPSVTLTDTDLLVRAEGINQDPQSFVRQLKALLDVADAFARFASDCAASVSNAERTRLERRPETSEFRSRNGDRPRSECGDDHNPQDSHIPPQDSPPQEISAPETAKLEKAAFLRSLWKNGMSIQSQKELFAGYLGREIEWDGVLKMHSVFSTDFVFRNSGGIKASFELDEFKPEGSFLPVRIRAVVAFPKESAPLFCRAYGKTFRFSGKLLKIEPVAREIYISDGTLSGGVES